MNDHTADASPASGGRALLWAAAPVVAVSAAFTFLLQPVVGKFLVPQVGGGAGLWVTTMCFFQTALFLGYGGAYLVRRWPLARQAGAVALLGVVAALTFRLPPDLAHVAEGWTGITLSLARALLPSVVLSTALGIVLQGWLAAVQGRVPFWLYGVSNAGSLLALLAYPFLIEPVIDLGAQAGVLRTILWVLVTAAGVAGVVIARKHARRRVPEEGVESIPPARWCGWIAASFLSCAWLIAATNLLQAEIGSSPLAWVIPFALYLIGFSLGFVASWPAWLRGAIAALVIVGHFGFVATRGVSHVGLLGSAAIWLLFVLFAGCLFIHREIYLARPARRYSQFYLAIAAGGMLAGIVCSRVLPNVLARPLELVACGTVASTWAVFVLATRAPRALRGAAAGLLVAASAVLVAYQLRAEDAGGVRVRTLRNHYGTVVLRVSRDRLTLASESTLHGMQYFAPELQRTPTAYYHEATAFGRAVRELQRTAPQLRYGAVGLGVGTAAAYLRPGDSCIFWEINPLMVQVAADAFSYLRGSAGKVAVELIDGRLGVERAKDPFDVLLLDAFSGDGVPAHLLTREAFRLYQAKTPRGVIFCHISNHHMDLFPVIAGHARALGWRALAVYSSPSPQSSPKAITAVPSRYALLFPPERLAEVEGWFRGGGPDGTTYHSVSADDVAPVDWTDGRHAIVDVLHWEGYSPGAGK